MGGAEFLPCWLFVLRQPNTGAYNSMVGLMADSGRVHAKEYFPELLLPVSLSSENLPTLAGMSVSVSYGVTAPSPWVLMCTVLCLCPPRMESLFPPVLLKSCNQSPLAFKIWFSGTSSSCRLTPRFGSLTWGSEPSLWWVDFCGVIVL